MTTIAYRDGILVSDSRSMTGGLISGHHCRKLYPLADGSCVAFTGEVETAMEMLAWLVEGSPGAPPALTKDVTDTIHLRADGSLWMTSNGRWFQCFDPYHAWGSGMGPALGVMAAGLDPLAAVLATCKVDPSSGGAPQTFALPHAQARLKTMITKAKRKGLL